MISLYYVDANPDAAARALCDRHIAECGRDCAIIMSCAYAKFYPEAYMRLRELSLVTLGETQEDAIGNHEMVLWASQTTSNYGWVVNHAAALCAQHKVRFRKRHQFEPHIRAMKCVPNGMRFGLFIPPPQLIPAIYQGDNAVEAYRKYYCHEEGWRCFWSNSADIDPPKWFFRGKPLFNQPN